MPSPRFEDASQTRPSTPPVERALKPALTVSDLQSVEAHLALCDRISPDGRAARACLIANLLDALNRGADGVHYSRDRSHYAGAEVRFYEPDYFKFANMMAAVDSLARSGLIVDRRAPPGTSDSRRSSFAATDRFLDFVDRRYAHVRIATAPTEPLRLKNDQRQLIPYEMSRARQRIRDDVLAQNEVLNSVTLDLQHPQVEPLRFGGIRWGDELVYTADVWRYRVFNRNFSRGGRWYGGWWWKLPSWLRQVLTIGGELVIERDYRSCHPRLLCAMAGLNLPFEDPEFDFYRVSDDHPRGVLKVAFNALLNTETARGATRALAKELKVTGTVQSHPRATAAVAALRRTYPSLEPYWGNDIGMRLQLVDAEMCAHVQRSLRRRDIACLSVHDSFIVAARHDDRLKEAMEAAMNQACAGLKNRDFRRLGYRRPNSL